MSYIDTSVLVPYYCPEMNSEKMEKIIMEEVTPAISSLTAVELASAVSRKIREGNLSLADGNRIIAEFQSHAGHHFFRILPVSSLHYQIAKDWIVRFATPLRTLDALHLAVAFSNNLTVLTADKKMDNSARSLGIGSTLVL